MLEIIALITLGRKIRDLVKAKGLSPTKYIVFMVLLWFGLEIVGVVVGMLIWGEDNLTYLITGYGGAIFGAFLSYKIAQNAAAPQVVEATDILDSNME